MNHEGRRVEIGYRERKDRRRIGKKEKEGIQAERK